jgi:hypothetical protein
MYNKDMSNIYISIFKRKGGEGLNTKIVVNDNLKFEKLLENEKPLILYSCDDEFLLITNIKLISQHRGVLIEVLLSDLIDAKPAFFEENKDNIHDLSLFS